MAAYTLYAHPRSGNSYRVALMLALTGTQYDFELVDLMDGSNLAPDFLKVNPLGKVPALRHGDLVLRQSHDCLHEPPHLRCPVPGNRRATSPMAFG